MYSPVAALKKTPITWIVVADSRQAVVYARALKEKRIPLAGNSRHHHYRESIALDLEVVPDMKWQADQLKGELGEEDAMHFVKHIAAQLTEAQAGRKFDRIILVAPPKILGELKKQLHENVLASVEAEVPKELTHYKNSALAEHLAEVL